MDLDMVMAFTEKLRDMLGSERITMIFPTFRFCGPYLCCDFKFYDDSSKM